MRKITILMGLAVAMLAGGFSPALAEDIAVIETKFGTIELEFFPDKAPGHVKNFKTLAKTGFYNGTLFHRVIPGFMIQGGDPNTKNPDRSMHGMGGPGYSIKAEFNDIKHDRGILSMARSQDPNSAGSQFYIVVKDAHFLDGNYTVFGKVTKGMEVVDKIVEQIVAENLAQGVSEAIVRAGRERQMSHSNPLDKVEMKISIKPKK